MLQTTELLNCIKSIIQPLLDGIVYFFTSFVRDDLLIFGVPFYVWVLILFVGGFLLDYFLYEVF